MTTRTTTELDLTAWCRERAKSHHVYETRELAYYPTDDSRDVALVEWTVRTLGNPRLPESVEALRILAERHGLELVDAGELRRDRATADKPDDTRAFVL